MINANNIVQVITRILPNPNRMFSAPAGERRLSFRSTGEDVSAEDRSSPVAPLIDPLQPAERELKHCSVNKPTSECPKKVAKHTLEKSWKVFPLENAIKGLLL